MDAFQKFIKTMTRIDLKDLHAEALNLQHRFHLETGASKTGVYAEMSFTHAPSRKLSVHDFGDLQAEVVRNGKGRPVLRVSTTVSERLVVVVRTTYADQSSYKLLLLHKTREEYVKLPEHSAKIVLHLLPVTVSELAYLSKPKDTPSLVLPHAQALGPVKHHEYRRRSLRRRRSREVIRRHGVLSYMPKNKIIVALMFILAAGGVHFFIGTYVLFRELKYAETLHKVLIDAYRKDDADLKGATLEDIFAFSVTAADQAFHDASQVLAKNTRMHNEYAALISDIWVANESYQYVFHDLNRNAVKLELVPDVLDNRLTYIGRNEAKDLSLLGKRASSFYESYQGSSRIVPRYYYVNDFCEWFSARWRDGCRHAWLG